MSAGHKPTRVNTGVVEDSAIALQRRNPSYKHGRVNLNSHQMSGAQL